MRRNRNGMPPPAARTVFDVEALRKPVLTGLGQRLGDAWTIAGQIEGPTEEELPRDRAEAYFVQDVMTERIGEGLTGWKVGATSAKMRELDGHDDVIPGRIFSSVTRQGPQHVLNAERFPDARAETEFAFRILQDIPLRSEAWRAEELASLAVLHPAIEIIGNRHVLSDASKSQRSLMTIADNGGGIGFVFGDAVTDWQSTDFRNHPIELRVDGGPAAENFLGEMRCEPLVALADLLNHLAGRGIRVDQGDFVSTGAATVPQPIGRGSRVRADFGALGTIELSFE